MLVVSPLSHVRLFATPWTVAYQAPLSMGFSRQEHWSGLPLPSPSHAYQCINISIILLIWVVSFWQKIRSAWTKSKRSFYEKGAPSSQSHTIVWVWREGSRKMVLLMVGGRTCTKEWREGELMYLMRREPAFLVWGLMSWVHQGG